MQLFTPQVALFHELVYGAANEYFLHAVTFCDMVQWKAAGHFIHPIDLSNINTVKIDLFVEQDITIREIQSLTPVVHTIELGPIDHQGEIIFETSVIQRRAVQSRNGDDDGGSTSGTTTSSSTSSKQVGRPIEEWEIPVLF